MTTADLHVFCAYDFHPRSELYRQTDMVEVVNNACQLATELLAKRGANLALVPSFELSGFGEGLLDQIRTQLAKCALCIVDISFNNPNVFYEFGMADAMGLGIIPIKNEETASRFDVPSDIAGTHVLTYSDLDKLVVPLGRRLADLAIDHPAIGRGEEIGRAKLTWAFDRAGSPERLNLVASASASESQFRTVSSPDFIYLDNLCDKDTLLELAIILSRMYPRSVLRLYSTEDMPRSALEEDLVLIGGTGTPDEPNNDVALSLVEKRGIHVEYPDVNTMRFRGSEYRTEVKSGLVSRDYGLFARFLNPFDSRRRVYLVQGIHTFGVLGAAKAFSLHPDAQPNHRLIATKNEALREFCAIFPVDVPRDGKIIIPALSSQRVVPLD